MSTSKVKFYRGGDLPLELHKVRVVQKLHLVPIERRLEAMKEAGFNTFRLSTKDVFLDMLKLVFGKCQFCEHLVVTLEYLYGIPSLLLFR